MAPSRTLHTGHAPLQAEAALRQSFDPVHGGFGPAPKFPQPLALRWLLGRWRRSGDSELLDMVTTTLDHMAAGGMFDQLGGGFHRYSVDARWLVAAFREDALRQRHAGRLLPGGVAAAGEDRYAAVARQTLDYVLRDMTDPLGGFYSSEDADSEGQEGKFYLWTPGEIEAVLGPEAASVFCRTYDVTKPGNFEGRNILNLSGIKPELANRRQRWPTLGRNCWPRGRSASGRARRESAGRLEQSGHRRPGPSGRRARRTAIHGGGWRGGRFPADPSTGKGGQVQFAGSALRVLRTNWTCPLFPAGRLLHCWRAGRARYNAYLDDYAGLGNALLTLYESDGAPARLEQAVALADEILTRFADRRRGGFFYTATDHEPLIVRKKDVIDNPVSSGNGLAAMLLAQIGGDARPRRLPCRGKSNVPRRAGPGCGKCLPVRSSCGWRLRAKSAEQRSFAPTRRRARIAGRNRAAANKTPSNRAF